MAFTSNKPNFGKIAKKDKDKKNTDSVISQDERSKVDDIPVNHVTITGNFNESSQQTTGTLGHNLTGTVAAQVSVDVLATTQNDEPMVLGVETTSVSNEHAEGLKSGSLDLTDVQNLDCHINYSSGSQGEQFVEIYSTGSTLNVINMNNVCHVSSDQTLLQTQKRLNDLITILIQELGAGMRGGPEGLARTLKKANLI